MASQFIKYVTLVIYLYLERLQRTSWIKYPSSDLAASGHQPTFPYGV